MSVTVIIQLKLNIHLPKLAGSCNHKPPQETITELCPNISLFFLQGKKCTISTEISLGKNDLHCKFPLNLPEEKLDLPKILVGSLLEIFKIHLTSTVPKINTVTSREGRQIGFFGFYFQKFSTVILHTFSFKEI